MDLALTYIAYVAQKNEYQMPNEKIAGLAAVGVSNMLQDLLQDSVVFCEHRNSLIPSLDDVDEAIEMYIGKLGVSRCMAFESSCNDDEDDASSDYQPEEDDSSETSSTSENEEENDSVGSEAAAADTDKENELPAEAPEPSTHFMNFFNELKAKLHCGLDIDGNVIKAMEVFVEYELRLSFEANPDSLLAKAGVPLIGLLNSELVDTSSKATASEAVWNSAQEERSLSDMIQQQRQLLQQEHQHGDSLLATLNDLVALLKSQAAMEDPETALNTSLNSSSVKTPASKGTSTPATQGSASSALTSSSVRTVVPEYTNPLLSKMATTMQQQEERIMELEFQLQRERKEKEEHLAKLSFLKTHFRQMQQIFASDDDSSQLFRQLDEPSSSQDSSSSPANATGVLQEIPQQAPQHRIPASITISSSAVSSGAVDATTPALLGKRKRRATFQHDESKPFLLPVVYNSSKKSKKESKAAH